MFLNNHYTLLKGFRPRKIRSLNNFIDEQGSSKRSTTSLFSFMVSTGRALVIDFNRGIFLFLCNVLNEGIWIRSVFERLLFLFGFVCLKRMYITPVHPYSSYPLWPFCKHFYTPTTVIYCGNFRHCVLYNP